MRDLETLAVYASRAEDYLEMIGEPILRPHHSDFVDALPTGGEVLDLGCGPGKTASIFKAQGLRVDAWDASPEMVHLAKEKFGITAKCAAFDELNATEAYDGIWANCSLLHLKKTEFPDSIARIVKALRPGGVFYLGMKIGEGEARDEFGRFYAFYTLEELQNILTHAGLQVTVTRTVTEMGLAGTSSDLVFLTSQHLETN